MEHDSAYRAWVDSNCESTCPGGECKADFSERVCKAFESLLNQSIQNSEDMLVIVAHGGTQMAVMEKYAVPQKNYYEWCAPTAGGYVLDARDWQEKHVLHLIGTPHSSCLSAHSCFPARCASSFIKFLGCSDF